MSSRAAHKAWRERQKAKRYAEPDTSPTLSEAGKRGGQVPRPGERNGNAKLTAAEVEEIRGYKGRAGAKQVGGWYEIHEEHVRAIWRGRYWVPVSGQGSGPPGGGALSDPGEHHERHPGDYHE